MSVLHASIAGGIKSTVLGFPVLGTLNVPSAVIALEICIWPEVKFMSSTANAHNSPGRSPVYTARVIAAESCG
jgi:hypothetical protein